MNVTKKQIDVFLALAELGSFSDAARHVGLSQPAFSLSIQRLEDAMRMKLFQRTSRTVFLTTEGLHFLPLARNLMQGWESTFAQMSNVAAIRNGRVAVAALPSLAAGMLPDVVTHFAEKHPLVQLEIRDVLHGNVIELVRSGQVDFGISVDPSTDLDIDFKPLLHDRMVAILRKDHPLAHQETVSWEVLSTEKLIVMTRATSVRSLTDRAFAKAQITPHITMEVDQLATISGLVQVGYGVSALPSLCLPVVARPDLTWRSIVNPEAERSLGLLTRRRHDLSLAANAFLDEIYQIVPNGVFSAFRDHIRFESDAQPAVQRSR